VAQHRAPHRRLQPAAGATPVVHAAGRRRAEKPARRPRFTRLPSLPTVLGVVALVVAGTGAITLGHQQPADSAIALSSQGSSLSGTDAVGYVGGPRARALSRDSERKALQDAADAKLQDAAEEQAAERNAELKSLGRAAEARAGQIAKNQWHLPTQGYHLTARFGMAGGLWSSNHTGLDFAAPSGTPIFAVANGVITKTGYAGAYGNQTIETLTDGTEIWYCHQSAIGVGVGDHVIGGQQIGNVGSTGNTTGPHVHLEVRPGGGDPVDPYQALVFHGVTP
jgi:murein DD-endopeptidase MepM/ murein hydrolase activator NlpD